MLFVWWEGVGVAETGRSARVGHLEEWVVWLAMERRL